LRSRSICSVRLAPVETFPPGLMMMQTTMKQIENVK
jgi:hypothetical protein